MFLIYFFKKYKIPTILIFQSLHKNLHLILFGASRQEVFSYEFIFFIREAFGVFLRNKTRFLKIFLIWRECKFLLNDNETFEYTVLQSRKYFVTNAIYTSIYICFLGFFCFSFFICYVKSLRTNNGV